MKHEYSIHQKIPAGNPLSPSLPVGRPIPRLQRSRTLFICCAYLLLPVWLFAQPPLPGGVSTPTLWLTSTISPDGQIAWTNRLSGNVVDLQTADPEHYLNFNPAFTFDQNTSGTEIQIPALQVEKWTLFTAYQSQDTLTEKSIWSYARKGTTKGILTTHRMADLQQFEYLNFSGKPSDAPQINTYLHYQSKGQKTEALETSFLLGQKPQDQPLPISSFTGKIPELILYERVLSPEERQRVESYLAIKYGTSLSPTQQLDYLNSSGRTLFAPSASETFVHRITGIGRDDGSGLFQKQSTSSYQPGLLTIGLGTLSAHNSTNTQNVPDQHFLLWADNDASFHWNDKFPLQALSLQRHWLIQTTGNWETQASELQFDTQHLRTPAQPGETYWLIIDRSGKGNFSGSGSVDYYPLQHLDAKGKAHFQDIYWDTDGSGRDVFTVASGPEFLVQAQIIAPHCAPEEKGNLQLKAVGGRPPFHFQLKLEGKRFREWTDDQGQLQEISNLPPGQYELLLRDSDHQTFREEFFLQSADAPEIQLAGTYTLPKDRSLMLDARIRTNQALHYTWQLPNGTTQPTSNLEISEAGIYTLQIDQAGCIAQRTIEVKPAPQSNFRRLNLFPNPSSDGRFEARIHLEKVGDLQLKIFEPSGRLLLQRQLSGNDYYHTGEKLSGKGSYLIQFRSQDDQVTIPFLVQ